MVYKLNSHSGIISGNFDLPEQKIFIHGLRQEGGVFEPLTRTITVKLDSPLAMDPSRGIFIYQDQYE